MTRVLVVDDELPIRTVVADVLRDEGYAVVEASNGLDALHEVEAVCPDVIVLDMMMPLMGGCAFAAACHRFARARQIPILLMSASPTLWRTAHQLRRFGVRGFVSKPFDLGVL